MDSQKFALVKWLNGVDKGKYTPGIPITWIRDFDIEEFNLCEDPNVSYVVEWRCGKKPKGGWKCYDIVVAEIAERVSILEKKLKIMDGILSPRKVIITSETNQAGGKNITQKSDQRKQSNDDDKTGKLGDPVTKNNPKSTKRNIDKNSVKPPRAITNLSDSDEDSVKVMNPLLWHIKRKLMQARIFDSDFDDNSLGSNPVKNKNSFLQDLSGVKKLEESNVVPNNLDVVLEAVMKNQEIATKSQEIIIKNQEFIMKIAKYVEELKGHLKCKCMNAFDSDEESENYLEERKYAPSTSKKSGSDMVEVGQKSRFRITKNQLRAATSKASFTNMGISLLMSMFSMKDLLVSSLRGGSTKHTDDGQKITRKALDPKKLEDLMDAVKERHKNTYNESALKAALNNKLSNMRAQCNKAAKVENPSETNTDDADMEEDDN